jgi:hypothetical protein
MSAKVNGGIADGSNSLFSSSSSSAAPGSSVGRVRGLNGTATIATTPPFSLLLLLLVLVHFLLLHLLNSKPNPRPGTTEEEESERNPEHFLCRSALYTTEATGVEATPAAAATPSTFRATIVAVIAACFSTRAREKTERERERESEAEETRDTGSRAQAEEKLRN